MRAELVFNMLNRDMLAGNFVPDWANNLHIGGPNRVKRPALRKAGVSQVAESAGPGDKQASGGFGPEIAARLWVSRSQGLL